MTITKLSSKEIANILTNNLEDWKREADLQATCKLNTELTSDDIETIVDANFYDALHDDSIILETMLDNAWINPDLAAYGRSAFVTIHNIYNR